MQTMLTSYRTITRDANWMKAGLPDCPYGIPDVCVGKDELSCVKALLYRADERGIPVIYNGVDNESPLQVTIRPGEFIKRVMKRITQARCGLNAGREYKEERTVSNQMKCYRVRVACCASSQGERFEFVNAACATEKYGDCKSGIVYVFAQTMSEACALVGDSVVSVELLGPALIRDEAKP